MPARCSCSPRRCGPRESMRDLHCSAFKLGALGTWHQAETACHEVTRLPYFIEADMLAFIRTGFARVHAGSRRSSIHPCKVLARHLDVLAGGSLQQPQRRCVARRCMRSAQLTDAACTVTRSSCHRMQVGRRRQSASRSRTRGAGGPPERWHCAVAD